MPSPFPGMDPYLEAAHIWEDFHASLAGEIRNQLAPRLRPRYVAGLTPRVTFDEIVVEAPPYSAKPDVSVYRLRETATAAEPRVAAPSPIAGRIALEDEIRLYSVEIQEVATGRLVTAIEILSPVNKRPGHEAFDHHQRKRRELMRAWVHLLEIDLLRAGRRWPIVTPLPDAPYFVFLKRAGTGAGIDIWPLRLQEPVPVVPVPLLEPDPDAPLDLSLAIRTIYDEAAYDLRIDYRQPPPKPDLAPEEAEWAEALLQPVRERN